MQNTVIVERPNATAEQRGPTAVDAEASAARLRSFVETLIERYRGVRSSSAGGIDPATLDARMASLLLGEAAVRLAAHSSRPLQVAIIGPTQAGKSTLVNLLLGWRVAEVSPLAGYTVHPQGAWITSTHRDAQWLADLFPGWRRLDSEQLERDNTDAYSLTLYDRPAERLGAWPPCVVWDTPDFDSLKANQYRRGVLEVAALADVYLLVLSKEKYSDLAVWRMLELIEPLQRPLIICLNKLTPDAVEPITNSLRRRLAQFGGAWGEVPITHVPYRASHDAPTELDAPQAAESLRGHVARALERAAARRGEGHRRRTAAAFLREHWDEWSAPLVAEHAALAEWQARIDAALATTVESYRRDYLDHPQRFDSFRRATAELLNLLELPGIGGALTQVRQVVTWPARKLFGMGRTWWEQRRGARRGAHGIGSEQAILFDIIDTLLTTLQRDAVRRDDPRQAGAGIWRALGRQLDRQENRLRELFRDAVKVHQEQVAREIQEAGGKLYEALQERPALLNSLRVARVTADVASIGLAVKTGGMHVNDLIFAPALFALTSLLTEGALGSYMRKVAHDLKTRQLENLRQTLIEGVFQRELRGAAEELAGDGVFGVPREQLDDAARALDSWERGGDG